MARNNDYTAKIDKQVGLAIAEQRAARGWSREQLSRKIGVTHQQLQKYEKGTNRISAGRLMAVAKAFNLNVSDLMNEISPPVERSRLTIELIRNFNLIEDALLQETIVVLTRNLATLH